MSPARSLPFASLLALPLVLAVAAPARAEEPYAGLLEKRADTIVSVKFVLALTISMGGQTQDQEQSGSTSGILVDKSGLVMIDNDAIAAPRLGGFGGRGGRGGRGGGGIDIKATPSDFRVVFPGETKEYPAILGATDAKVGLAFVRIKDLEGREVKVLEAESAAEIAVGDVLYGVARHPEGFDYAPYVGDCRVSGRITKPREMWDTTIGFGVRGHPVFTRAGAIAGVLISQEGVGGGAAGTFVLPWKAARTVIEKATKASETALEEAKKAEDDAAAKPADKPADAPAEKPSDKPADKPSDGEKPSDGGADAPK